MSGYENRPGDVTIYKEREKKNEKGPDWKGFALVTIPDNAKPGDTIRMEIAVWNKGQYGTMLGGKIGEARKPQGDGFPHRQQDVSPPRQGGGGSSAKDSYDLSDDIPF